MEPECRGAVEVTDQYLFMGTELMTRASIARSHGMISQIPSVVYAVSISRTRRYATAVAEFSVHHVGLVLWV
jgi:hypothetical protein